MTKNDDFKRIVRGHARQTGQSYSAARAELEPHRRGNGSLWLVIRTFPGAEEQVQQLLAAEPSQGVTEVLIPRFRGRRLLDGLLLLRLDRRADPKAIGRQPWLVGHLGAGTPLDWEGVRAVLRRLPAPGWPRRRTRPFPLWTPSERTEPFDAEQAFAAVSAAAEATTALTQPPESLSDAERQALIDHVGAGLRARRDLLEAYRYVVDNLVAEFEQAGIPARVEIGSLRQTGMNGLGEAIGSFPRSPYSDLVVNKRVDGTTSERFVTYAATLIRFHVSQHLRSAGTPEDL